MKKIRKFLKKLVRELFPAGYEISLDPNLLADETFRRRFTAPSAQASKLFALLNHEVKLAECVSKLRHAHTLIRFAVIGQNLCVLGYRAASDLPAAKGVYPVFDPHWAEDGMFHYLIGGNQAELLTRNSHAHLVYDAYEPEMALCFPLSTAEVDFFSPNWVGAQRPA